MCKKYSCVFPHCYTLDDDSEHPMNYELSLLSKVFPFIRSCTGNLDVEKAVEYLPSTFIDHVLCFESLYCVDYVQKCFSLLYANNVILSHNILLYLAYRLNMQFYY